MIEYINKTNKVTDQELILDLIEVSKTVGKVAITIAEYEENGKYNSTTYMRHFGTWNNALEVAGLKISNRQYTLQELYDNLAEIWLKIGHQPSRRDLTRLQSPISYKAYERRFGKWSNALQAFVEYYNTSGDVILQQDTEKVDYMQHRTTRDINLRMRFIVMQRDNFKCCLCGASPAKDPNVELHIDHIMPWAKGGETVIDNLQTLCQKCNLGKSDLLLKKEQTE